MTVLDDYLARTPRSRELFERATESLPGGSTRTTVYTAPYPPYVASGAGLRIRDVDGNDYRDFLGNYTSLILGHAHPAVVAAVEAQVRRGSAFAAATETEVELAEEIRAPLPPRPRSSSRRRSDAASPRSSVSGSPARAPRRRCSRSGPPGRSPADRSSPSSSGRITGHMTASWPGRLGCPRPWTASSWSSRGATRT